MSKPKVIGGNRKKENERKDTKKGQCYICKNETFL